jgi:tRNA uridine 5-carboxymethylaminomethyl modification enzyme
VRSDVIVVGAGHAGCEAAAAAARLGARVVVCTHTVAATARLSCNPAIGGLGKGHLVRELDALGGLMARAADATTVQFRRLNTRKGLAVRSSRAQVDVDAYPSAMAALLGAIPGITWVESEVAGLVDVDGRVDGVVLADGAEVRADAVILTTGTFLGGVMHRGEEQAPGGRVGDGAAKPLAAELRARGLRAMRLKTGTVPRVHRDSVAWRRLPTQEPSEPDGRLSFASVGRDIAPLEVRSTYTNPSTHAIIAANLHRSPMVTGAIEGVGPRYCPSVEDKVRRFADRDRHLLFLEPEGHHTPAVYVAGLSTSLPADVQEAVVHSIEGLERAEILRYGYAVEYDAYDPRDLGPDLQHRGWPGLYLAGQINGTSGYEEAAVQGFVAGVSAARRAPLTLSRTSAYVGVLIDDLRTAGVGGEPYRMLTSRAEHRLLLREDNADRRLMPIGRALGLVDDATWAAFEARAAARTEAEAVLDRIVPVTDDVVAAALALGTAPPGQPASARTWLLRPEVDWQGLRTLCPELPVLPDDVAEGLTVDVKYAGYVARAERRLEQAARSERVPLPADAVWAAVPGLSTECRERIAAARPADVGSLSRIPGVTPAAVSAILVWLAAGMGGNRAARVDTGGGGPLAGAC